VEAAEAKLPIEEMVKAAVDGTVTEEFRYPAASKTADS
jgi:hypothetical protein